MKKKAIGRPKLKEVKENTTLRFYKSRRKLLEKRFGRLQVAIDTLLDNYFKGEENGLLEPVRTIKQRKKAS